MKRISTAGLGVLVLFCTLCLASPAAGATKTWIGGTGQWNTSGNWSPSGQPKAGDDVLLTQTDATTRTVTYYTTNPTAVLNSLKIDATGTGTMTLNMPNSHALNVTTEYVGYDGKGIVTQSAGTVKASTLYLGYNAGGDGTYTSTGGTLSSSGNQYIGYAGAGALNIQNGVKASDSAGYLGYSGGSSGTATVTGAGSTWANTNGFFVGYKGSGTLRIEAGGEVSDYGGRLGAESGSTGTVTVTGAGSKWTNSTTLYVGGSGSGTLNIEKGGQVSNSNGYLSFYSGSTGTATVTGAGSKWTNSGNLYVGREGKGTLTVADGGLVSTVTLYASPGDLLGDGTISAQGALLDVDLLFDSTHGLTQTLSFGNGGVLNLSVAPTGSLGVGYKGPGTLRIADGVTVASYEGFLGRYSGSSGTATVTGNGSKWTNSIGLYVGLTGSGRLNIEAGAQVSNKTGYVGNTGGGTVTVTGAGSKWTSSGNLEVGTVGVGTLTVEAGGQVSSTRGYIGDNAGSTGTATVTGNGSKWTNGVDLYVGSHGNGTLNIEASGQVSSNHDSYLGFESGSSGTATVTGAGSTWTITNSLCVGYRGNGTLNIEAGGTFHAANIILAAEGGTSLLRISGTPDISAGTYSQSGNGELQCIIGADGISPIKLSGAASAAGMLTVINAGAPLGKFNLIESTGITGIFSTVNLPGPGWSYGITGGTLWVEHAPAPVTLSLQALNTIYTGERYDTSNITPTLTPAGAKGEIDYTFYEKDAEGNPVELAGAPTDAGEYFVKGTFTSSDPAKWTNAESPLVPFTIGKAAATVTVNGYSGPYDGQPHGLTGTATGVGGEDLSGLLNLGAAYTNAGGYTEAWSFAGNENYKAAHGSAMIAIGPRLLDAVAEIQDSLNVSKNGVIRFRVIISDPCINDGASTTDGKTLEELFDGEMVTIFLDGTGYSVDVAASVEDGDRMGFGVRMNPDLEDALLSLNSTSGKVVVTFSVSAVSNDGNYAFATHARTRLFLPGKVPVDKAPKTAKRRG